MQGETRSRKRLHPLDRPAPAVDFSFHLTRSAVNGVARVRNFPRLSQRFAFQIAAGYKIETTRPFARSEFRACFAAPSTRG